MGDAQHSDSPRGSDSSNTPPPVIPHSATDDISANDDINAEAGGIDSSVVKDERYWEKRRRNNEAAKRSREKRRINDLALEKRVKELKQDMLRLWTAIDILKVKYKIREDDPVLSSLPSRDQDTSPVASSTVVEPTPPPPIRPLQPAVPALAPPLLPTSQSLLSTLPRPDLHVLAGARPPLPLPLPLMFGMPGIIPGTGLPLVPPDVWQRPAEPSLDVALAERVVQLHQEASKERNNADERVNGSHPPNHEPQTLGQQLCKQLEEEEKPLMPVKRESTEDEPQAASRVASHPEPSPLTEDKQSVDGAMDLSEQNRKRKPSFPRHISDIKRPKELDESVSKVVVKQEIESPPPDEAALSDSSPQQNQASPDPSRVTCFPFSQSDSLGDTTVDEQKYKQRRSKNNAAARRCRENRKKMIDDQELAVQQKESENDALKSEVQKLKAEFNELKLRVDQKRRLNGGHRNSVHSPDPATRPGPGLGVFTK